MRDRQWPLVTIVIPARNEAASIADCIRHVALQDFPLDHMQIIVVDGSSTDATVERAEEALASFAFGTVAVLCNPAGTTPSGLNVGLAAATGEYLCRVDARSFVPPSYVRDCVELLLASPGIAVVGGAQVATACPHASARERGIARALRNPYATGLARYRRRRSSGATDTVYLGTFRTEQLRLVGGWDERLHTNQDYELNRRMQRLGTVWFVAGLDVAYRPRSTLAALVAQYYRFGRWKALGWREIGLPLSGRHLVLLSAPPAAAVLLVLGARFKPAVTCAGAVAAVALLDGAGGESAPAQERAWSLVSTFAIALAWWAGAVEQLARPPKRRTRSPS
ncbi:MAG: glycosyltransferase [Acidimicrobiales bacterium]